MHASFKLITGQPTYGHLKMDCIEMTVLQHNKEEQIFYYLLRHNKYSDTAIRVFTTFLYGELIT